MYRDAWHVSEKVYFVKLEYFSLDMSLSLPLWVLLSSQSANRVTSDHITEAATGEGGKRCTK